MGSLYIIGNGLDLHFDLQTKPEDFENYLKKQCVYNSINNAFEELETYGVDWSDYEQSLNQMDLDQIEEENAVEPDYLSDHESDRDSGILNMKYYVDSIQEAISTALRQMVDAADKKVSQLSKNRPPIKLFHNGDAILTFNYTSTVESLFCLPENVLIHHIHGCYKNNECLIFGYKRNKSSYSPAWSNLDENSWDYYIQKQREQVYQLYKNLEKRFQFEELEHFLNKCAQIDNVVVLGHSMGDVDAAYMDMIEKKLHPQHWKISYYKDEDKTRVMKQNYAFMNKISFFKLSDII